MNIIDLSHTLAPSMPVYPGTEPPAIHQATTIDQHGFAEKRIQMYSHTGTHVDAPAHMIAGAQTLDRFGIDRFFGRGCAVDASSRPNPSIDMSALESSVSAIREAEFVLFHTGWSKFWGQERYFVDFPVLSEEVGRWLTTLGLKGVGLDTISVDPLESFGFENHRLFFRAGMIVIENLTGLEVLIGRRFHFSCLPLKVEDADGSPVRAIAILE